MLIGNVVLTGAMIYSSVASVRLKRTREAQLITLQAQLEVDKRDDARRFAQAWFELIDEGDEGDEQRLLERLRTLRNRCLLPNGQQPRLSQSAAHADIDDLLTLAEEVWRVADADGNGVLSRAEVGQRTRTATPGLPLRDGRRRHQAAPTPPRAV